MLPRDARLGAVHARRDAGAGRDHARRRSSDEQRIDALDGESREKRFMLHYNFPPFSRRRGRSSCAARAGARSATARSPSARSSPVHARRGRLPVHDPHRVGHPRVERLVVDGHGVRRLAVADGRGRADQGAGRRHRDGPDQGGRAGRDPVRHPRRRGPPRRHGLQGRRHAPRASPRFQMDIKIGGITPRDPADGASSRPRPVALHILDKMAKALAEAAREHVAVRAAHHHAQDPARQDPRRHRPGRQGDPGDHRGDRRQIDIEDDGTVQIASSDGGVDAAGDRPHHRRSRRRPRSARSTRARSGRSSTSARSSRSCRAPTACCTSRRSRTSASATSPTCSRRATRCWSRSSRSTVAGRSGCRAGKRWRTTAVQE